MHTLAPFFTYDVDASMLHGQGPIAASTLAWIRDFPSRSSFAFFWPHITVGYGEAPSIDTPVSFTAVSLALCHLGNHCTCRKVLTSVQWNPMGRPTGATEQDPTEIRDSRCSGST
jgi:hypothetical protein